jgi:glycosyltransferase involved in cell wall biosynthesis
MSPMLMEAIADQILTTDKNFPEVSIIMPCLNEEDTLATCIGKARRALDEQQIAGEIIVADNGSTDGSQAIATNLGARLVNVRERRIWQCAHGWNSGGPREIYHHGRC